MDGYEKDHKMRRRVIQDEPSGCNTAICRINEIIQHLAVLEERLVRPVWNQEYVVSETLYEDLRDNLLTLKKFIMYHLQDDEAEIHVIMLLDLIDDNIRFCEEHEDMLREEIYTVMASAILASAKCIKLVLGSYTDDVVRKRVKQVEPYE